MFEKLKDMYKFQQQARTIKKELKNTHIEATEAGITVVVSGEQEVVSITINDDTMQNKSKLENSLTKALNRAMKKSQQLAAEKMKTVMGPGFPGV